MNITALDQQTAPEIALALALRLRARRKERGFTQVEMSQRADMSLGSLRRFETTGEIALKSLIKLAVALDCEQDFEALFARRQYRSIQEIIDEQR
jgi:transcriptional regulator with XRE-family HTH domain